MTFTGKRRCVPDSQQFNQREAHVKRTINLLFEVLQPKCQECVNEKNKKTKAHAGNAPKVS